MMTFTEKLKKGYRFKDKFGNVYHLEQKTGGSLFSKVETGYILKCSELDKSRGEVLFNDSGHVSVYFKGLNFEKWVHITDKNTVFLY